MAGRTKVDELASPATIVPFFRKSLRFIFSPFGLLRIRALGFALCESVSMLAVIRAGAIRHHNSTKRTLEQLRSEDLERKGPVLGYLR